MRTHSPDVIFISEVRSPALGPTGCKKGDGLPRQHGKFSRATNALAAEADTIARFCQENGYRAYWSLAEYKYAGSGMLAKASGCFPSARARGRFFLSRSRREADLRARAPRVRAAASVLAVVHDVPTSNQDSSER